MFDEGLVTVGDYEGRIEYARFETFDFEACLDELQLIPHPKRSGGGAWYGHIRLPGMTAYLIGAEKSLARLARAYGFPEMAARREVKAEIGTNAMRAQMWDDASDTFLALRLDGERVPVATIGSWIPLWVGVPTNEQAARMAARLQTPDWNTLLPVPTVGRSSRFFDHNPNSPHPSLMWRGDVWPPTNYQIASGLHAYGFTDDAARIADTSVQNAIRQGINERYHPDTGHPEGVSGLGMSCSLITMMLDSLTRRHSPRLIDK